MTFAKNYLIKYLWIFFIQTSYAEVAKKKPAIFPVLCKNNVKLNIFGDVYIAPGRLKPDYFNAVEKLLAAADYNIVNFEGVISDVKEIAFPKFPFALKLDKNLPALLAKIGIKYVTRANNHSMDFGAQGMWDTSKALTEAGISYTGVGNNLGEALEPIIIEHGGVKIAIFSVTATYPALAWANEERAGVASLLEDVYVKRMILAVKQYDFVVALFHWGQELSTELRPYQIEVAQKLKKIGVQVIAGHHAHTAQKIELNPTNVVAQGLGNFVFASNSPEPKIGLGMHVEFCKEISTSKKKFNVVFTALNTTFSEVKYNTRPFTLAEFKTVVASKLTDMGIDKSIRFYIPEMEQTKTLGDWVNYSKN